MKTSKTRVGRKVACLLLVIALAGLSGVGAIADTSDELREEFHQTYPLSANGRISLHNVSGTVHITAWDRNEVRVDAVKRAERRERLAEAEIKVEATADSIRIWTKYPDDNFRVNRDEKGRDDSAASVDYTLSVPRTARLDSIQLVSGSLEIAGVSGDVRAATVSGHLKASGLAGEAKLSTVSAPLEATFERLTDSKPVTLNSVSGSIVLTLPSDVQAELKANTLSGEIANDFGLEARRGGYVGHELYGQLGKGGVVIRLNNVSGQITIHHAADGKAISPSSSLLSQRQTESAVATAGVRRQSSEALIKAQRDAAQARAELRRVEREANTDAQSRTVRAMREAERSLGQARAELQRVQSDANSEAQRAAKEALTEAERKLAEARADLERTRTEANSANSDAQRQRSQALSEAQRKMAQAQAELERVRREELSDAQRVRIQELTQARVEVHRVQREMQLRIQRETQTQIRTEAREAARGAVRVSGGGMRFRDAESKTFTVSGKPRITIGTFDGRITIHAWDKNEVQYTATKRAVEENTMKGISLRAEQKGSEVSINASLDDAYVQRVAGVKSINASASIEIYVPRNASIHASTGEGGMEVEGISGEIDLRNSSGSIVATNCKGSLTVNAESGRVQVSGFDGELDARTGKTGRVYLGGHFTKLSAQTNNEPIVLALSADTNAIIEANSPSVTNEGLQASEETGPSQRPRRFKIGRGGPLFTLRSGEGRIILRRADSGPM